MTRKSHTEDEWFAKHERDLIENLKRERIRREKELAGVLKKEEGRKRKELHWMKCPKCGANLEEIDLSHGILIDECKVCRGIFLVYGELELIRALSQKEKKALRMRLLTLPISSGK